MTIGHAFLGLLEKEPVHGYELKRRYDLGFSAGKPLPFGQVYSTLARLTRAGLVQVAGLEYVDGPERKLYVITPAGLTELEEWLDEPAQPKHHSRGELFGKVIVAIITGRDPRSILDAQRAVHLKFMRELTDFKRDADFVDQMACDLDIEHLAADIRWIERSAQRAIDETWDSGKTANV